MYDYPYVEIEFNQMNLMYNITTHERSKFYGI